MRILFNYCYYRIRKFYKDWGESGSEGTAGVILYGCLGGYFLSMLGFILSAFNIEMTEILVAVVILFFIGMSFFFVSEKKYKELEEHYKNEKHSKLKGWFVFTFCISSWILFIIVLYSV